jgi:hypothetical protein
MAIANVRLMLPPFLLGVPPVPASLGRHVVNHDHLAVVADSVRNLADLTLAAAILVAGGLVSHQSMLSWPG